MIKYGMARSRSNAINIMIEQGIQRVKEELAFWREVAEGVEGLQEELQDTARRAVQDTR